MATAVTVPRRHIINRVDNRYQIIPYDIDNLYPQRISNIISSSGAATICQRWFSKFIFGQGVDDVQFFKTRVNKKNETVDAILKKMVNTFATYGGFAVHFNYNALGEKTEMQVVPFGYVRMESAPNEINFTGRFKVYSDWDGQKRRNIDSKKIQIINEYNLEKVLIESEEEGGISQYNGQLYYHWQDYGSYPIAIIDAELESAAVDSEIKEFNYSNVLTGFLGAHIAEYPFEFENNEAREDEIDNLNRLQGAREANKILMVENKNAKDAPFRLHEVKASYVDNMFLNTEKVVRERIRKMYEVPPAFLDVVPGSLGAEDIRNAYDFYNAVTQDYRMMFESVLIELFRGWHQEINFTNNYKIKPLDYNVNNSI